MSISNNLDRQSLPIISGYAILEILYLGSRTAVYRGVQTATQQPVVIKVLRREYPSFGELVQFRNQYTIAKNLPIPGIVRPLSLESLGNSYALVMEDWGGMALNKHLQQQSLNLKEVLAIALQLADILHDLGQHRVVHKDIKPANILIQPESKQVKLIDFSIASLLPKETQEIQSASILEGTLAYLAPEQTGRMNRGIDYRADFYALGVTLYQLLVGKLPFESNDPLELMHCHIAKQPPALVNRKQATDNREEIPSVLADIVMKLMAKNAEDRYQSAMGLKYDLEQCLTQWKANGEISEFELGKRDLSDRFLIPEKLYGREQEVQTLLQAFDRVADGSSELMLVAGFSGIGKTAVVNEVHKPIVRQRGYFIKGKFDQFNRNIPLSAFVQALRDLMGQLLSESDKQLTHWKTEILAAVGENGQVLIDVIPELERIIGSQPIATELSGTAAQNRFNLLFQKFIEVFTTADHPLVIFLDDLQWADLASLQLLKLLMNDNGYLLLLGAYRDNEVSPAHPFIMTVAQLQKAQTIVNTIFLKPLAFEDTNHLVADTLNCSTELAQPLTELVDRKTQGNPFFTTQFLKALHDDGYIHFNSDRRYWECDIARVNILVLTDDVVEFMALQLQKLPAETQQVLKLAACLGNQFDLATLAIVSERSSIDAATALWKALQEGLILPTNQIYKFFQDVELPNQESANPHYRFLHDRVQQAAYSLIPEDRQQSTHLAIARLLRQNTPDAELESNIFEIVNHWNSAIALLFDPLEKTNLAQLNLIAGNKAKAANAYELALTYCRAGLALLEDLGGWQSQASLMLALHEGAAAAAYLCGDFAQMEQWVSAILAQNLELLDRVKTYEIQTQAYSTQSQFPEAIAIARNALEQFNIHLPKQPTPADIVPAMQDVAALLNGRTAHDLLDLPVMTDVASLASMQLLSSINATSYVSAPLLFPFVVLAQVKLSIQAGNTALSASGYSAYAILLSGVLEDLEAAYEFGQLGLKLVEKFKVPTVQAKVNVIVGAFIIHCKSHLQNSLPLLTEAFKIALEVGDFEYTGYSAAHICQFSYAVGQELTTLLAEIEIYIATLLKLNIVATSNYSLAVLQTIQRLQTTQDRDLLTDRKELHHTLTISNDLSGLHFYWVYRLTASYLLDEIVEAKQDAAQARQTLAAGAGLISTPIFYFYDSLTAFADLSEVKDKMAILDRVSANQVQLQNRAHHAPMNFQHKFDLVEAERYRVLDNKIEAIDLYDRAIAGAKENGYIQEEALANELAAKFYLAWGKEKIASGYMQEAYYCYTRWGAKAKTDDLEQRYPSLLRPILENRRGFNPIETLATIASPAFSIHTSTGTSRSSSSSSVNATLDFVAILRASQSLSSTIQLDDLLHQLTQIILQNSGADRCALILSNAAAEWEVRAIATPEETQLCHTPLQGNPDLPTKLIYYVKNKQEAVVIDDCETELPLVGEYLSRHRPKSILCLPILNQGNSIGILYLQNQLTCGVFTSDRILVLNFLCTQAAISLENARLYDDTQKSQRQLAQLLNNLTGIAYSCANDENWTMNFISGGCLKLTGYPIEDFIDNHRISFAQLIHPDDVEMVDAAVQSAVKNHQPYQIIYRIRTKQGKERWVWEQGQGVFDRGGELLGLEGFVNDISDRKRAEIALQEKEVEYRSIFESVNDGLSIWDLETGQVVAVNPALCQMYGCTPEEFAKLGPVDLVHPDYLHVFNDFLNVLNSGRAFYAQGLSRCRDGSFFNFEAKAVRFLYKGKLHGLAITRDISDRKAAETVIQQKNQALEQALIQVQQSQAQVVQSEKMSALGNLVAGVAHEINNPIGFLKGSINNTKDYVQDLLEHLALYQQYHPNPADPVQENAEEIDLEFLSEDLPKMLDSMQCATDRIKGISTSLRTFSRADTEYKVSTNLHEGLDSTLLILKYRLKANEYRPAIEVIQDYGNLPSIYCFPGQLNQVFMNILANAIDALDDANTGRSFAEIQANPNRITIRTTLEGEQVKIAIADNGPGIPEEVKSHIFDHLFTTKPVGKGTGLGLAIARQIIVEKHGGTIEVNSTLGRGTEFAIALTVKS